MVLLRLIVAFALVVAIPLQGFAASTCKCNLHQALARADVNGQLPGSMKKSSDARFTGDHGPTPSKRIKHPQCASCSMSCCKATVSGASLSVMDVEMARSELIVYMPSDLASWAEPVPDKPPRF